MNHIDMMKQALEALQNSAVVPSMFTTWAKYQAALEHKTQTISDLRTAIEQAKKQEPVAWRVKLEIKLKDGSMNVRYQLRNEKLSAYDEPLYTTPPTYDQGWKDGYKHGAWANTAANVQEPPPECETEAEKRAYAFGWWRALEANRAAPVQEPVTWRNAAIRVGEDLCSVGPFGYYDMTAEQWLDWALSVVTVHAPSAAQRQWVGLTEEDIKEIWLKEETTYGALKMIEAKLREKNTGERT